MINDRSRATRLMVWGRFAGICWCPASRHRDQERPIHQKQDKVCVRHRGGYQARSCVWGTKEEEQEGGRRGGGGYWGPGARPYAFHGPPPLSPSLRKSSLVLGDPEPHPVPLPTLHLRRSTDRPYPPQVRTPVYPALEFVPPPLHMEHVERWRYRILGLPAPDSPEGMDTACIAYPIAAPPLSHGLLITIPTSYTILHPSTSPVPSLVHTVLSSTVPQPGSQSHLKGVQGTLISLNPPSLWWSLPCAIAATTVASRGWGCDTAAPHIRLCVGLQGRTSGPTTKQNTKHRHRPADLLETYAVCGII